MTLELVICIALAAIGFSGWWFERRRNKGWFRTCKDLEEQNQALLDAARFVLTEVRQVKEGCEASLETFDELARALRREDRLNRLTLLYGDRDASVPSLSDRSETASVHVANVKAEMRRELAMIG